MCEPDDPATFAEHPPTRFFGGKLLLHQPRAGHRAGTDAILLASAAHPEPHQVFADVGAGVGTVGLALAQREPRSRGHLLEAVASNADFAVRNVALNGLQACLTVHVLDLFDVQARSVIAAKADLVVSNPPFFTARQGRPSPDPVKARAHVLRGVAEGHGAWLRAALSLLAPHGRLIVIHRPDALPELLAAAEGRLGGLRVRPIHAGAGEPAIRILFGGQVGTRAPFSLLDPLILHEADGRFTSIAEALHRGEALLPLFGPSSRQKKTGP